jgi:F0F1-type ATP synthase membrane subunit b/b'
MMTSSKRLSLIGRFALRAPEARGSRTAKLLLGAVALSASLGIGSLALAQPHTDPHHPPAADPTTGQFAHEPPDTKGHDKTHPEGHDKGHHGPAPINWTDLSDKSRPAFIALLINFGLLAGLYYTLAKKPVVEGLKQRRVNIGKDIDDARKMLDEAKERAKKYQADLKNADADAATAKATLVSSGKGEMERLLVDTEERAERMKRDAERLIEQERKQLEHDLLLETIEAAVSQAHKVLERSATPEDHARLANELLAELARKPAAPRVVPASAAPKAAAPAGGVS